jgi:Uma2 family endonuclease
LKFYLRLPEAFDRGNKICRLSNFRKFARICLINTSRQRVECFRRGNDGLWILQSYIGGENSNFQLQSIDFTGTMASLYEEAIPETVSEQNSEQN